MSPDAWHGATVRSAAIAHGVLEGIELDPAFDWSQVVVATAADIPGKNAIALIEDDQPALVAIGAKVMHHDEAIAVVAAPTRALAFEAKRAIRPRVRPLPAIFTVDDALAVDKQLLYGVDNIFKQFLVRKGHTDDAAFEVAIAGAAQVVDGSYYTSPQEQMYIEPQAMMAEWRDGRCFIVGARCKVRTYVHKAMKVLLGCDGDGVVITQSVTGGGFGGKEEYPSMLAAHVAVLARRAGRAVKMTYDRDEDIAATTKRHPAFIHPSPRGGCGRRAGRDRRRLRHGWRRVRDAVAGRWPCRAACCTRRARIAARLVRAYAAAWWRRTTRRTARSAASARPQTTFAYERQIQKLARLRGENALALRSRLALRERRHDRDRPAARRVGRHRRGCSARSRRARARRRPAPIRATRRVEG